MTALELSLRALDIGPGDEVIVPGHTFIATWLAVSAAGAIPVGVDVDPASFNLDPAAVEAAITPRTRCIIPVHLYGQPADMLRLREIAARHGIAVLEDAAQAHGASVGNRRVGGLGKLAAFSFYPTKNLGALGDGGAVLTNDEALANRLRLLRNYGSARKYEHEIKGRNARLDELQAALLRVKLTHLDGWNARRRDLAALYNQALAGIAGITAPGTGDGVQPVWHLYVIRVAEDRDGLQRFLAADGIATLVHYPLPPHLQAAYRDGGTPSPSLPVSERLAKEVLSLPLWPQMDPSVVARVAARIRDWRR
jgi:dTDP-4-amino-4,6-dideoxygalactose transaminase